MTVTTMAIGALTAGCVKINTQTEHAEDFVEDRTSVHTITGSVEYHPTASVHGTSLTVVLRQQERCETTTTPLYRKTAHHTREPEGNTLFRPMYVAVYGLGAIALGAGMYLDPDGSAGATTNADDNRPLGVALGAFGVGLLALAAVDQFRLRDTDQDLGVVEHAATMRDDACHERAVARQRVVLGSGASTDWSIAGTTDAVGRTRFALNEVPEAVISGTPIDLVLDVDGTKVPLTLSGGTGAEVVAALSADPNSRLMRDRQTATTAAAAAVAAACTTSASAARELQREIKTTPDAVLEKWKSAKTSCGALWDDAQERELVQAVAIGREVHIEQEGREFDSALAAAVSGKVVVVGELRRAELLLAALGALAPPDPKLAERTANLAAARKRAMDALLALSRTRLARNDFNGALEVLSETKSIMPGDLRSERLAVQIEARRDAKWKEEERSLERSEGPLWAVYWRSCATTLAERSREQGNAIRAKSSNAALKQFCKESCAGYEGDTVRSRVPECVRNCMALIGPTTTNMVDRCMRVTVERSDP